MASLRKILNWGLKRFGYQVSRLDRLDWTQIDRYRFGLATAVGKKTGYQIQEGPFKGMQLQTAGNWSAGDVGAKLLGFYEQELHEIIEKEIKKKPELIINVGAADGYYAVGLKQRLADSRVIAFEIDQQSREDCQRLQDLNFINVEIFGKLELESLKRQIELVDTSLVVMDCEGCEVEIACIDDLSVFRKTSFIIECHDMFIKDVTKILHEKLSKSHNIEIIMESGRNPNGSSLLKEMNSFDKMLLCCELRGTTMNWLYAVPK